MLKTTLSASLQQYFDRVLIINLPDRQDRRQAAVRELNRVGLSLTPNHIEFFPGIRPETAAHFPSRGARGCFLSHLAILKQAYAEGWNNVLILEDDAVLPDCLRHEQFQLVAQLQSQPWDFVYFGHFVPSKAFPSTSTPTFHPYKNHLLCAHFYAVNQRILAPLIAFLEALKDRPIDHPDGGAMHLDGAYNTFRDRHPEVITLVANPSFGGQRSFTSDITPAWYHSVPGLPKLVGLAKEVLRLATLQR
jgi:glycosyl transferase, family 25